MILLDRNTKNEYRIKTLTKTEIKIQPKTSIKYILIVKELQARNTDFYIYKIKEERSSKETYVHLSI